jgi:hypothetical protein
LFALGEKNFFSTFLINRCLSRRLFWLYDEKHFWFMSTIIWKQIAQAKVELVKFYFSSRKSFSSTTKEREKKYEENDWKYVTLVQYHFGPKLTLLQSIVNNSITTNICKKFTLFWTKIIYFHFLDQNDMEPKWHIPKSEKKIFLRRKFSFLNLNEKYFPFS